MFSLALTPNRLAIQALLSVTIAIIIQELFHFDHSYWAVMTSVILISQTWGESVRKSFDRIVMTVLGGTVGTVVYLHIPPLHSVYIIIVLAMIFMIVLLLTKSYRWAAFCIAIMVVFAFGILQHWDYQILLARIIETCIGGLIVALVTAVVLPVKSIQSFNQDIQTYIEGIKIGISKNMQDLLEHQHSLLTNIDARKRIFNDTVELSQDAKLANVELFSRPRLRKLNNSLIAKYQILSHYTTSLLQAIMRFNNDSLIDYIKPELEHMVLAILSNVDLLNSLVEGDVESIQVLETDEIRAEIQQKVSLSLEQDHFTRSSWFELYSMIYFLQEINHVLTELIVLYNPDALTHHPR